MKNKIIFSLLLTVTVSSPIAAAKDFDVYGRDMDIKTTWLASFGHLGIEKNNKIYNMSPSPSKQKTLYNQDNYMHITNIQDFKNTGNNFWGVKYEDSNRYSDINYYLILSKYIGATYSYKAYSRNPSFYYNKRTGSYSYNRGIFRCDTFVRNALIKGGNIKSPDSYITPEAVFRNIKNTRY